MEIVKTKLKNFFILNAEFSKNKNKIIGEVTEDASKLEASINLGDKLELTTFKLKQYIKKFLINANRNYQININSFICEKINEEESIKLFIEQNILVNGKIFSTKTKDIKNKYNHIIISNKFRIDDFSETIIIATEMASARYFQDMPPNICTTNFLTHELEKMFSNSKKIKTTILDKNDLEKLGMNLILSVNSGSNEGAKVVVCEYNNNLSFKNKIAIVGKGIIFDSGGYDLKRNKGMLEMKYDMSGAVIAAHILNIVDKLNLKVNISIVLPITDNLVDSNANLPESIIKSFSGKTIEVANTDAEGRLILADGISYASKKIKANTIIDISTLTGSVLSALGHLYTGVWSSSDENWNLIKQSAKESNEKVWRMPLDPAFNETLSQKTFADIKSCSNSEYSDCNIAASWLYSFVEDEKEYIHFDIAGTANIKEKGKSPIIKTIVKFIQRSFEYSK